MAATDGLTFEGTFNHVGTGLFKNNTAGDIGADDVRTLVTAVKESYVNRIDDAYTAPFPQVTASGTDTYTATLSPAITAYAAGQKFQILFTNANTGAATLALNGLSALAITKNGATALAAGDIPAGSIKILAYDGTRLQILGDGGGGGTAATTSFTPAGNLSATDVEAALYELDQFRKTRTVTGADSIVQTDDNSLIIFNSATPLNFTLDQITANSKASFINIGAGAVTFVNGSGVTSTGETNLAGASGTSYPAAVVFYHTATTPRIISGSGSAGVTYWQTLPGTPTRVGNTSLTITDTGNAGLYDLKFSRSTVLKWTDSGSTKMAMVSSASYSSNTVTINLIGDVLSSGATMASFTYALEKCKPVTFGYAGTVGTGTNITSKWFAHAPMKVFGGQAFHGTAGTTGATTYDVNKNGSTMFTTKLSVASAATVGTLTTADDGSTMAGEDVVTIDVDSVSTTAPVDAYVYLYVFPLRNQLL